MNLQENAKIYTITRNEKRAQIHIQGINICEFQRHASEYDLILCNVYNVYTYIYIYIFVYTYYLYLYIYTYIRVYIHIETARV